MDGLPHIFTTWQQRRIVTSLCTETRRRLQAKSTEIFNLRTSLRMKNQRMKELELSARRDAELVTLLKDSACLSPEGLRRLRDYNKKIAKNPDYHPYNSKDAFGNWGTPNKSIFPQRGPIFEFPENSDDDLVDKFPTAETVVLSADVLPDSQESIATEPRSTSTPANEAFHSPSPSTSKENMSGSGSGNDGVPDTDLSRRFNPVQQRRSRKRRREKEFSDDDPESESESLERHRRRKKKWFPLIDLTQDDDDDEPEILNGDDFDAALLLKSLKKPKSNRKKDKKTKGSRLKRRSTQDEENDKRTSRRKQSRPYRTPPVDVVPPFGQSQNPRGSTVEMEPTPLVKKTGGQSHAEQLVSDTQEQPDRKDFSYVLNTSGVSSSVPSSFMEGVIPDSQKEPMGGDFSEILDTFLINYAPDAVPQSCSEDVIPDTQETPDRADLTEMLNSSKYNSVPPASSSRASEDSTFLAKDDLLSPLSEIPLAQ